MASLAGRPLAELLQEQQEPFLLDVYLLENGYSGRILCSEATATCWPGGTACKRLQACSHGFRGRGGRILGPLLGVFSRRNSPRSSNWGGGPTPIMGAPAKSRRNRKDGRDQQVGKPKVEAERALVQWECTEEAKQLSPVSVLELHSDDGSPAHEHAKEEGPSTSAIYAQVGAAVGVFGGLHGSSSSHHNMETHGRRRPAPLEEERTRSHDQSKQREQHLHGCLGSHRREKARHRRRRRPEAIAASHLEYYSDVSEYYSMRSWINQFDPHVMEFGAEVGEALLDELVEHLCLTIM